MKKFICIILIVLFALTACVNFPYVPPYGKWESTDGTLILDINPAFPRIDGTQLYRGTYFNNETETAISICFTRKNRFIVFDSKQTAKEVFSDTSEEFIYFYGDYSLNLAKNKMKYKLLPYYQKRIGYPEKRIIFNKIGDYQIPKENAVKR